jgi:hypothetical protein
MDVHAPSCGVCVEYYTAMKKKEIMVAAGEWMGLDNNLITYLRGCHGPVQIRALDLSVSKMVLDVLPRALPSYPLL